MKFYKQTWFWLMVISLLLTVLISIFLYWFFDICFFMSECFWVAVGSIGSLISVLTATQSIKENEIIRRQKDTYSAFSEFKKRNYDIESEMENYPIEQMAKNYLEEKQNNPKQMESISRYLCDIEQLATCVNTGVFDVGTIYNMGGPFFIEKFELLYPIIETKRRIKNRKTIYLEFENMVDELEQIRENYRG